VPALDAVFLDEDRIVIACKDAGVTSEAFAAALGLKLVHRIDRGTSGLVMLARDARTVQRLQRLLRDGGVERTYAFVANGVVAEGARESWLVRDRGDGLRGSGDREKGGKHALMHVLDARVTGAVTHARARLVTGRTHQLRIQLAEAGTPIVGERVYVRDAIAAGVALAAAERLLLHAERLRFVHPNNHRPVDVVCAAPFAAHGAVPLRPLDDATGRTANRPT
jgi:23S rRNA pseudouridine1911/1915/1917 synthase